MPGSEAVDPTSGSSTPASPTSPNDPPGDQTSPTPVNPTSNPEGFQRDCFTFSSGGGRLRDAAGVDRGFVVLGQPVAGVMQNADYTLEIGILPCMGQENDN